MKQNIFIAALLAGMLVLAGCGGGSSATPEPDPVDPVDPAPPVDPTPTTKTAGVPNNQVIAGNTAGLSFNLATGELRQIGNYWFRCTGGTCAGSVAAGAVVGTVSYTGTGTLEILASNPTLSDSSTGNINQPTESTDPLSNDVLVKALNSARTATNNTVWNTGVGAAGARIDTISDGTEDSRETYRSVDGEQIDLYIDAVGASNVAYFGHWVKSTQAVGNERVFGDRGTVWGGATPYGKKPDASLGATTATYGDTSGVLLYHSANGATWNTLEQANATLTLQADFATGMVGGSIDINETGNTATGTGSAVDENDIELTATMIGNDGKFSGSAGFSDTSVVRDSGTWNGGFFGSATSVSEDGIETHVRPSAVAGEFSVSRPAVGPSTSRTQTQLHIRGAFGGGLTP